jgi:hypothetical protein
LDAVEGGEHRDDLAVRQSGLFVEEGDGRLAIRTDLTGGGAQGVGGLQGVPPLNASPAVLAAADVDVEAADERLAGDFGLDLVGDAGFDERALAVRTGVGELGFECLIEVLVRRLCPIGVRAAVVRFASRPLGFMLGFAFTEWSGLPLPGPLSFFELAGQFGNLVSELGHLLAKFLAARTRWLLSAFHDRRVTKVTGKRKGALNKY